MKKEKTEFTILRYLGRPPSLFDDAAIEAVREILETAGEKFDWDKFTEYAVFHKLSQTLYPNLLTYNKSEKGKGKKEKEESRLSSVECRDSQERTTNNEQRTTKKPTAKDAKQRQEDIVSKGGNRPHRSHPSHRPHSPISPKIPDKKDTSGANPSFSLFPFPFSIPTLVVSHFRGIFLANAARNEFLAKELVKLNKLMEDNGIEMLNWKGPTLAIQAYGDLSLRQFKDLDTLVKQEDLEKAKAILLENGFADITPQNRLPEYSAGRGYEFFNTKKKYELELEYSIFLARSVLDYDYDGMFDRASSVAVNGDQIKTLSIEDNLLFTSFHGTKHLWFRLRWLCDILGKFELNKKEILSTIDTFEQKQLIAFSIYIALKEFNIEESANFTNLHKLLIKYKIKDLNKFEKIIHKRILQHNDKDKGINHYQKATIITNLVNGKTNKRNYTQDIQNYTWWNRIKRKIKPNQLDYNLIKLPKPLFPLYFIVKAARVTKRLIKKAKCKLN